MIVLGVSCKHVSSTIPLISWHKFQMKSKEIANVYVQIYVNNILDYGIQNIVNIYNLAVGEGQAHVYNLNYINMFIIFF